MEQKKEMTIFTTCIYCSRNLVRPILKFIMHAHKACLNRFHRHREPQRSITEQNRIMFMSNRETTLTLDTWRKFTNLQTVRLLTFTPSHSDGCLLHLLTWPPFSSCFDFMSNLVDQLIDRQTINDCFDHGKYFRVSFQIFCDSLVDFESKFFQHDKGQFINRLKLLHDQQI